MIDMANRCDFISIAPVALWILHAYCCYAEETAVLKTC